jgi:hypothetical protein
MDKNINIKLFKKLKPYLEFVVNKDKSIDYYIKPETLCEDYVSALWIDKSIKLKK